MNKATHYGPITCHFPVVLGSKEEDALIWLWRGIARADVEKPRIRSIQLMSLTSGGSWRWRWDRKRRRDGYGWECDVWINTGIKFPRTLGVSTGASNPPLPELVEARVMKKKTWWHYDYEQVEVASLAELVVLGVAVTAWYALRAERRVPTGGLKNSYPLAHKAGLRALENWRTKKEGGLWD